MGKKDEKKQEDCTHPNWSNTWEEYVTEDRVVFVKQCMDCGHQVRSGG